MSGNLTKYQLLQHRHLSLLRALQDVGVQAKCNSHGDWDVITRHRVMGEFPRIPTMDDWARKNLLVGCNRALAPGQYWTRCGESDMGQTSPALCTNCGGNLLLADPGIRVATPTMDDAGATVPVFTNHNPADWLVDVPKLYKGIAPPLPGLPSHAPLSNRHREYAKLKYAYDAGEKTIKASLIPTIIKSLYNPETFAASMPYAPTPELDDNPQGRWTLSLTLADGGVRGWANGREYNVPADAKVRDLLRCLSGVIFAAPAKA